jgi:hypothetical protein
MDHDASSRKTIYMSVDGNRGSTQINSARPGTTKELSLPSPQKLNYQSNPDRPMQAPRQLTPTQVKTKFLGSVTQQLRESEAEQMDTFVYHGHGGRGEIDSSTKPGNASMMTPGAVEKTTRDPHSNQLVKSTTQLRVSGQEFAHAIATSFSPEPDKDKARSFQFDSCWLGNKRGKNSSSFVSDFTSHLQQQGFSNFTVTGSRTKLNTTGNPEYAATKKNLTKDISTGTRVEHPPLASGIPSLPSRIVNHPTQAGKFQDLRVSQHVPSHAALSSLGTVMAGTEATRTATTVNRSASTIQKAFRAWKAK